jgi:hypothetical protein
MKEKKSTVAIMVASLLLVSSLSLAQPWKGWRGSGGWGIGTPYSGLYNPALADNLTGEVVKVEKVTPLKGMTYGVQILLKTEKETIPVHLGPGWYVERLDIKIGKGDKIEVKGARTNFQDNQVIIAGEIKKGENLLVMRDAHGTPVWAGWRR